MLFTASGTKLAPTPASGLEPQLLNTEPASGAHSSLLVESRQLSFPWL